MFGSNRSRRFRPVLDVLPSRIAPSDVPVSPSLIGWTPPTPPPPTDLPQDPTLIGWTPPTPNPTNSIPIPPGSTPPTP